MIVDCAVYEHGQRRPGELPLDQASEAAQPDGAFVWLGVVDPTAEELQEIAGEFHLHELAVEDAINAHQRPKAEIYDETLLVVVKTACYVDSEEVIEVGELLLFVHPSFVIAVRHGRGSLVEVRKRLERRKDLLAHGPGAVLYGILDHVVDDYEAAGEGIDDDIQSVEQQVFSPQRTSPAERIYKLERETLEFHRAVAPLLTAVDELARGDFDTISNESLHPYFRDVHDHLQRIQGRIIGFRELLGSALQANLTQISVRQNEDMRKISAWVAIAAVPTMVFGLYGMNFDDMPELHWHFGYPAVLVAILAVCFALYRSFRRAGWL